MTETGLTLLNDKNYKEFIADGVSVVLVSLMLPVRNDKDEPKECPYCVKLKAKAEGLTHRKIGTLIINDNSEFKREYFKTIESGKAFPVIMVFENGAEKYRASGDMPVEQLEAFLDTGIRQQGKGINLDNATVNDLKALIYDEIIKHKNAENNIKMLEQMLASRQKG